ncbi:FUSC family protein [Kribbella sp. NPDC059898]|uniref:FUSC family protein n=1 Tax=Kribbella sp. NPDC059898 TaxID=3346995 RepID=UPI00364D346F
MVQWSRLGVLLIGAATLGAFVGGRGWLAVVVVGGLAVVAAVGGGFSRGTADGAARFLTFLVMATGLGGADAWQVTRWFAVGVLWAIVLSLVQPRTPEAGAPTYPQLWRRWRRNLRTFDGWQYAVRLVPPLAVALTIGVFWHQQKSYWIALAVVGVLAGLRPLLKERNYAAYATIMTPLVVLLMDLGRTPELSTVGYRLADTVIGCLLAIIPTLMLRRRYVA